MIPPLLLTAYKALQHPTSTHTITELYGTNEDSGTSDSLSKYNKTVTDSSGGTTAVYQTNRNQNAQPQGKSIITFDCTF